MDVRLWRRYVNLTIETKKEIKICLLRKVTWLGISLLNPSIARKLTLSPGFQSIRINCKKEKERLNDQKNTMDERQLGSLPDNKCFFFLGRFFHLTRRFHSALCDVLLIKDDIKPCNWIKECCTADRRLMCHWFSCVASVLLIVEFVEDILNLKPAIVALFPTLVQWFLIEVTNYRNKSDFQRPAYDFKWQSYSNW